VSFRVLVICEDPTHDQFILRPLLERLLTRCDRGHSRIHILTDPWLRGKDDLRKRIGEIVERYASFDLLLCIIDSDGKDCSGMLDEMMQRFGPKLLCCAAVQEVEAWLLAGHPNKLTRPWSEVREDPSVKETEFTAFLEAHGDAKRPGAGREELMVEGLRNFDGILRRCPELEELRVRIAALLSRLRKAGSR
jgi:hypothetical protein